MKHVFFSSAILVVSIFLASPSRAQDVSTSPLKLPTVIWATAAATDWATTYRFSRGYHDLLHETNPLIRGFDSHPAWLVTTGAAIDVGTWWAGHRIIGRSHPRWMAAALYGGAAFRVYLAAYNMRMMREAQAIRQGRR